MDHPRAFRSSTQSLLRIQWPTGYSKSHSPANMNPAFRQMAFEAALSTEGNACRYRCFCCPAACAAPARAAPVAIPRASRLEHTNENRAAADIQLDQADLSQLDQDFPRPRRVRPLEML